MLEVADELGPEVIATSTRLVRLSRRRLDVKRELLTGLG